MTTPANTPTGSTVAVPWADNMALGTLNSALSTDSTTAVALQQAIDTQRFWATPPRAASDVTYEVMQVTLSSPRLINQLIFDVAIFPHSITVEYYNDTAAAWQPLLQQGSSTPVPVTQTINTSYPLVLPPITNVTGHVHPQHSFSGHWQTLEFATQPVTARLFRVLLIRTTNGTPPTDVFGNPVDYSLAIRNFYIGYQVQTLSDVPLSSPVNSALTTDGTFASTTDLLGSTVNFTMQINAADNVLRNQATESNVIWKCEPQPFPWAVVSFYVDTRDEEGNPQVIDRFYLEPLYTGPTVHIYYSNDTVTSAYAGTTEPLIYPVAQVFDPDGVGGDVLHSGRGGIGATAFVQIDNQVLSFDPSRAWWVGASVNDKVGHGSENYDSPLFDCGAFQIFLTPFGIACQTIYGDTLAIDLNAFDPATTLTWIVAYDGIDTLSINAQAGPVTYTGSLSLPVPLSSATVTTLRVGAFLGVAPGVNNFDFNGFVLKTDDVPDAATIQDFLIHSDAYVQIAAFASQTDPRTMNALLRYHPGWVSSDVPSGFIGGEPNQYNELVWSPIARDYVLTKGNFDVPSTKAKYWKFEFTGLIPEPYEVYKPITSVVRTFTNTMTGVSSTTNNIPITPLTPQGAQLQATYQVNNALTTSFDGVFTQTGTSAAALGLTPTQARVLVDSDSRTIVGKAYWAWNFLPIHSGPTGVIFTGSQKHVYETINVTQTSKIAYFVGLVSVAAYRLDALATDDTIRYVDNFYDLTNISQDTNWVLVADHQLTSGAAQYAVLESQPLNSTRIVTAVQFAAQQSDPIQYLPDPDFNDPTHANWTVVGDASLTPGITVDTTVGNTLQVSRATVPNNWSIIEAGYPAWHNITDLNLNWSMLATSAQNPALEGGITSGPITLPAGGRITAAARVIAATDLVTPLVVQIVDDQTNQVVSESQVDVKAHQVTEWYTSFTLGDVTIAPWRWADFLTAPVTQLFVDGFHHANGRPLPPMDSGQVWSSDLGSQGQSLSLSIVNSAAQVTTDGQYNYVDVAQPWGTLEFQVGTIGTSETLLNLIVNPNFFSSTTGWTATNSPTLTLKQNGGLDGQTSYLQVTSTNASAHTTIAQTTMIPNLTPGYAYRWGVDLTGSIPGNAVTMTIQWYNSSNTLISTSTSNITIAAGWNHYDVYLFSPVGGVKAIPSLDFGVMTVGSTVSFTNAYFQFGAPSGDSNFIPNASFETNTTGWVGIGSPTITRVSGGSPQGGSFSAQVKSTQATSDTAFTLSANLASIQAGVTYEFRADVNPSGITAMNMAVNWYDSTGTTLLSQSISTFSGMVTGWQTLTTHFTAPTNAVFALPIVDGSLMPVNSTYNVDNVFFGVPTHDALVTFDPFMLDEIGVLSDNGGTPLPAAYDTNVLTSNNGARSVQPNDDIRVDVLPTYLVPGNRQDIAHSSNPDPVVWPYSLMFYLNGTWMRTVSHDLGARTLREIKGRLNQRFLSWSWTPFAYGQLLSKVIMYLPRLDKGQWVDSITQKTYQSNAGTVWTATGSWDLSTPAERVYADNYGPPLTVVTSGSTFVTDVGVWYGAMSVYVRNIATGQSGAPHGDVLVLDADNGVTLNYAGNIMQAGTSYGTLISGGVPTNAMVTVHWVRTAQVTAATRGSINATTFPDMLVAKVNGQIVGTFATAQLQTWRGTKRGLSGDIYNPGSGSRPTTVPNYTLDTSFRAFHWAPDASLVAQNPAKPTWNDITNYNSITYDEATRGRGLTFPALRAQVVQYGQSNDVWDVDNLSLFVDPIVWSFSNDGGVTFLPAYDIRNNPSGVLSFPTTTVVTSLGRTPGTTLIWRATSYAPDRIISSIVIRPWYAGLISGATRRIGVGTTGPNLSLNDQTPPLSQDPAFQVWSNPVPQSWWYQFKLVQRAQVS